jgi:hypothetical protein
MLEQSKDIIKVEKEGKPIMNGVEGCKSMNRVFEVLIGKATRLGNEEQRFFLMGLYNKYKQFHPDKILPVEVEGWHGKSSFEIIKDLDRLIIVKYQKKEKGDEPTEVRTEITKEEIGALVDAIKEQSKFSIDTPMETRKIAFRYCVSLKYNDMLNGDFWKNFFSNRSLHNKFTLMLGALDKLGLIEYKGGKTKLLNKDISLQLVLE